METMTAGDVEGVDLMGVMQLETHPHLLTDHVTHLFESVSEISPSECAARTESLASFSRKMNVTATEMSI